MFSIYKILENFPSGKERFYNDSLFIIDTLIKSNNGITEAFHNYILKR